MQKVPKRNYDEIAKHLMTQRDLLANVLKVAISEYQDLSISEIKELISDIDLNQEVFEEDRTAKFLQNELTSATEGKVVFDLLFPGRIPNTNSSPNLMINIEIQNKIYPEYDLLRRTQYYLSRMVSMQKNRNFFNSNYRQILKCYTIWICFDSPDSNSHIYVLSTNSKSIAGNHLPSKKSYDVMETVIIYLGKNNQDQLDLIDILNLVFLSKKKYNVVCKELKDLYGINLSSEYKEDFLEMCNLSERFIEEGHQQGLQKGIQQGIQQGIETGKIEMAINLAKEYHLDLNQILEKHGITQEQYQKYIKEQTN